MYERVVGYAFTNEFPVVKADIAVAQTNREAWNTLIGGVKSEDFFRHFPPVQKHLDRLCTHDKDGEFFWIFQNMDYKGWKCNLGTLVLSAPHKHNLEKAACCIIHELQKADAVTVPLHFSCRVAERRHLSAWRFLPQDEQLIAVSLHNFLWQLIDLQDIPKLRQKSILTAFLGQLLSCRDNSELPKVLAGAPEENVKSLMDLATLNDLCDAFEEALKAALDVGLCDISPNSAVPPTVAESQLNQSIQSLTLIFDLDDPPVQTWESLLQHIRTLQRHLSQVKFKLLVINPPMIGDLGLEMSRSEIHIVYDKERQGFIAR